MTQTSGKESPARVENDEFGDNRSPKIRVLSFTTFVVVCLTGIGLGTRYYLHQDLSLVHSILILFFSINVLICYWEACLYLQRSRVEKRTEYWRERKIKTGRLPHVEFFASKVPWTRILSPSLWADVWATYSQYDPSFADRRTYGFSVDTANGFLSLLPTLLLYASFTVYFLPPRMAGILGLAMSWQWVYMTSVYWISFFVANRQVEISRRDLYLYVLGTNAPWVLCPLLGLFVSIRLILDGNYSVLG